MWRFLSLEYWKARLGAAHGKHCILHVQIVYTCPHCGSETWCLALRGEHSYQCKQCRGNAFIDTQIVIWRKGEK